MTIISDTVAVPFRPRFQIRTWALYAYATLFFGFLYVPILVLFVLSFNDSQTMGFPIRGFTGRWYAEVFARGEFVRSIVNSFMIGIASASIATALALLVSLGLRREFPFRGAVVPLMLLPIIMPGIVSGVVMLVFFGFAEVPNGLWTGVLAAHITWVMPFSFLTLYPRLHRFDRSIEEAAMDLGATPIIVFRRILWPLIWPAIIATVLFSFTLSFDEFIRTLFVIGSDRTTPVYLWLLVVERMAPFLPAVGVVIVVISTSVAVAGFVLSNRASALARRVER